MSVSTDTGRVTPELTFVANVALRIYDASSVGETPDGVRMVFQVRGRIDGPRLQGEFPSQGTLAFLRIDRDGVGTIDVRAPLALRGGAKAELVAKGLYDFGEEGYSKAKQGPQHLPDSDLGWCPRLLTSDPSFAWLNRTQFLGVGKLVPREARVDYDLYAMLPGGASATTPAAGGSGSGIGGGGSAGSLYDRLGGREGVQSLMSASIDALHGHAQLNRQNPRLAAASRTTNRTELKKHVTNFVCQHAGGPGLYDGRSMAAAHAQLGITEADWSLFMDDTAKLLRERGVPGPDQRDLLALMDSTKADIVS